MAAQHRKAWPSRSWFQFSTSRQNVPSWIIGARSLRQGGQLNGEALPSIAADDTPRMPEANGVRRESPK